MSENQNPRHVVSITTGCHSTYLLLRMVEEEMPINAVLFADTGVSARIGRPKPAQLD